MLNRQAIKCLITLALCIGSNQLLAIPALQLGPGDGSWNYDTTTGTWELTGDLNNGSLDAYALPSAWDSSGLTNKYAYLVVSAIPQVTASAGDVFDITLYNDVDNDGNTDNIISLFDSGWGTPPPEDTNSLGSHGIFPTYFEIYKFAFNGASVDVANTQPGSTPGTQSGWMENFKVNISDIDGNIGLHFDLFTVSGDGTYTPNSDSNKNLVEAFAPYTHDATYCVDGYGCTPSVPEPGSLALMALGLLGLGFSQRKRFGK